MKIDVITTENGTIVVRPYGKIDAISSKEFGEAMQKATGMEGKIEIDLAECEYISSSGLRVLLKVRKACGNEYVPVLYNTNEVIDEILDMTGFSRLYEIRKKTGGKPDIRAAFFDVDGTIFSHTTGRVPESTKQALKEAQAMGVETVLATGRMMEELMQMPVAELDFDGYLTLNGNICLDRNGKMFAGNEIDPGEVQILVSIFEAGRIPFVLIGEKERYINYVDDVVIQTQKEARAKIPDIGKYKGEKIYQCLAYVDDATRQKLETLLDHCHITSWNKTGIDIIAKTGGKAAGIRKFLEEKGWSRSQIMAFGDGENDIDMIKYAGIGVAMGNGVDALKQAADYVTTSVDEDGIANALRHFELI